MRLNGFLPIYINKTRQGAKIALIMAVLLSFQLVVIPFSSAQKSLPAEPVDLSEVRADLQKLDATLYGGGTAGEPGEGTPENGLNSGMNGGLGELDLPAADLTTRAIYRDYLRRASGISRTLLSIQRRMDAANWTLSLQQLGALSQGVVSQNERFRDTFDHGEESFYSYQLIQQAVTELDSAMDYWRKTNRYQSTYRGTTIEKADDDEVLKLKLEKVFSIIEELKALEVARRALDKLDTAAYP